MINPRKEHLLIKFLSKEASALELDELEKWINNSENELILKDFVKVQYAITIGMNKSAPNKTRERLFNEIRKDKNAFRKRKILSVLKYAAVAVLFMGVGYFFQQSPFNIENQKNVVPAQEVVTLETKNGEVQELSNAGSYQMKDKDGNILGEQKGNKLVYHKTKDSKKLTYNVLKVPYGKRFDIFLSDGTHVFLNAGSSLKYPVNFPEGKLHRVFLEGEAYFDVVHDSTPFLVNAQELDIKVYGTKFNVTNYASDNDIDVVLVDGSVGLKTRNGASEDLVKLSPGFKGGFNKTNKKLSKEKVDTTIYTAWMDGKLIFNNTPFKYILKRLERQYNVVIINNNETLGEEAFNATFKTKKETLEQIFEYFKKIHDINYKVFNNKIIID